MQPDQNITTILIIESNPEKRDVRGILKEAGYDLRCFRSAGKALKSAQSDPPDLILFDMRMPEADSIKTYRSLKSDNSTKDIPVLFLDESGDVSEILRAFELDDADDYLTKPFQSAEITTRIKRLLSQKEKIRALESLNIYLASQIKVQSSELKKSEEKFRKIVTDANEGIVLTDADLRIIYVNDAMTELLRGTPKEILGRKKIEFIPVNERKKFHDRILKRKIGQEEQLQTTIKMLDGETRWVQLSSAPIMDENDRFQGLVAFFTDIHDRKREQEELAAAYEEIRLLKKQLEADNVYLREEIKEEHNFSNIVGQSDAINYSLFRLRQVAETDSTVVVLGETGTGKELFARALHGISKRSERPLVKVDCAAMTEQLIESELFGYVKGAFTGADQNRIGRFELAHKGTLFLDEFGELPLTSQVKLLRLLEEGEFERLGDSRTLKCDVRIIAATNRNISELVQQGKFRSDLWHRLNVFPITIPPLRKRKEDIPLLVKHFVDQIGRRIGKNIKRIPASVMEELTMYDWPGNVRELYHLLERSMILCTGPSLLLAERLVDHQSDMALPETLSHADMEIKHLVGTLEQTNWVVEGPNGAARILKMHPNTLRYRMKKHGISRPH